MKDAPVPSSSVVRRNRCPRSDTADDYLADLYCRRIGWGIEARSAGVAGSSSRADLTAQRPLGAARWHSLDPQVLGRHARRAHGQTTPGAAERDGNPPHSD